MANVRPLLQYTYHTVYCAEDGNFKCDCDDFTQTGRPCVHILAVMMEEANGPVEEYIGEILHGYERTRHSKTCFSDTEKVFSGKASVVKKAQKTAQKKAQELAQQKVQESAQATTTTSHVGDGAPGSSQHIDSDPEDAEEELKEDLAFGKQKGRGQPMSDQRIDAESNAIMKAIELNEDYDFSDHPLIKAMQGTAAAAAQHVPVNDEEEEEGEKDEPAIGPFAGLPTIEEENEDVVPLTKDDKNNEPVAMEDEGIVPSVVSSQLSSTPGEFCHQ